MKALPPTMACIALFLCRCVTASHGEMHEPRLHIPSIVDPRDRAAHAGRLAEPIADRVLESISMFGDRHVRAVREFARTSAPELDSRLVVRGRPVQCGRFPLPIRRRAGGRGRLTFPDLAAAFEQIRGTLGRMPGTATEQP